MTLLRGHNLDTGGSSYAGKTTIPLAISYALGFLPFSAKDQKMWGSEGPMFVELEIGTDEGAATIRAGDKPWLKLPDGRKVTSATAIKEGLAKFLKVNPDVLAALTYQQQGEKSRFLSKTDSEKKEFLSNVMPWLVKIEQAAEVCDTNMAKINIDMATTQKLIEMSDTLLQGIVVQEPVLVQMPLADQLKAGLQFKREALANSIQIATGDLAKAEMPAAAVYGLTELVLLKKETSDRWNGVRSSEAQRIQDYNSARQLAAEAYRLAMDSVNSISVLKNQISTMEDNRCPTCWQDWLGADGVILAQRKEQLRLALLSKELLPGLLEKVGQVEGFVPDPKIAKLENMMADVDKDISKLQIEQNGNQAKRMKAIQAASQCLHSLRTQEQQLMVEINNVDHQTAMVIKENEHRKADYAKAIAEKEKMAIGRNRLLPELEAHQTRLKEEQDFQALIGRGGFLGSIFDEVLREISEEANIVLASVANTAHVTINFLSEVSTLKGKINKTIQGVVTIGGNTADFNSGASGGMKTSIGLAVDLAVATVVSRRTNTWPGWLIQDESFEGLDQASKESCLEILRKHACNRLILVVDHASETKELFTSFIDVEFQNGVSKVL